MVGGRQLARKCWPACPLGWRVLGRPAVCGSAESRTAVSVIYWCNDLGETVDFIAYVVLSAPDDFPAEDAMDLGRAFDELRHGLDCSAAEVGEERLAPSRVLLQQAYVSYMAGQVVDGAGKLQQLQRSLMAL